MTEIKIEKKSPVWPWILAAVLLLAVIAYFIYNNNDNSNDTVVTDTTSDTLANKLLNIHENDEAVGNYLGYIETDSATMSLDHNYSSNALKKLIDATQSLATKIGFDITADMDKANSYAKKITEDPNVGTHADMIANAAVIISNSLKKMQEEKYPSLDAEGRAVLAAGAAINPNDMALDQKKIIQSFYSTAGELLRKMN